LVNENTLICAAIGNDLIVAVGDNGIVITYAGKDGDLSDAESWTEQTQEGQSYKSICFGNGKFVAVGDKGLIITSHNGLNWTSNTPFDQPLYSVCQGSGYFIAVGQGVIVYSEDGFEWKLFEDDIVKGKTFNKVTYSPLSKMFVAVGVMGVIVRIKILNNLVTVADLAPYMSTEDFNNQMFYNGDPSKDLRIKYGMTGSTETTVTHDNNVYLGGKYCGTSSSEYQNTVIGSNSEAQQHQSTVVGFGASTTHPNSVVIGVNSKQTAQSNSVVIGVNVEGQGKNSIVIGNELTSTTSNCASIGNQYVTTFYLGPIKITVSGSTLVFNNVLLSKSYTMNLT
jgi:hypothetical protein